MTCPNKNQLRWTKQRCASIIRWENNLSQEFIGHLLGYSFGVDSAFKFQRADVLKIVSIPQIIFIRWLGGINLFPRSYNHQLKFNFTRWFSVSQFGGKQNESCWYLESSVLLLSIGHCRKVTWWRCLLNKGTGSTAFPKFLWLLVVSASAQQAFHHDWALLGNLEDDLQWKLWGIHETIG